MIINSFMKKILKYIVKYIFKGDKLFEYVDIDKYFFKDDLEL